MSKVIAEFAMQLQRIEHAERTGTLRRRQVDSLIRLAKQYARAIPNPGIDPVLRQMQLEIGRRTQPTPLHKLPGSNFWAIEAQAPNGQWVRIFDGISALPTARIRAYKLSKSKQVLTRVVEGSSPGPSLPRRNVPLLPE